MRKFVLFAVSALLVCPSMADAQVNKSSLLNKIVKVPVKKAQAVGLRKADASAASKWKATHEKAYSYDEESSAWELESEDFLTYDSKGNVLTDSMIYATGEVSKRTNTFNENGMVTMQYDEDFDENGVSTPSARRTFAYDTVVTSRIVKREAYTYDADTKEWTLGGNSWTRTITRDEAGNVTSEVVATLYNGAYDPSERTTITYKDGKADRYVKEMLEVDESSETGFSWGFDTGLKNIVWEKTNGQVLGDVSDFYEGDNLIKSATMYNIQSDGEEYDYGTISVEYDGAGGYVLTSDESGVHSVISKVFTDGNGSFEYTVKQYMDLDGDGAYSDDEIYDNMKLEQKYDENGNDLFNGDYEIVEDPTVLTLVSATKNDYKYDATCGAVAETLTSSYEYDGSGEENYIPMLKVVHDQFVDVTSTTGISSAKSNASKASAVYDLQGRRLSSMGRGVNIVRYSDGAVRKVYVK